MQSIANGYVFQIAKHGHDDHENDDYHGDDHSTTHPPVAIAPAIYSIVAATAFAAAAIGQV